MIVCDTHVPLSMHTWQQNMAYCNESGNQVCQKSIVTKVVAMIKPIIIALQRMLLNGAFFTFKLGQGSPELDLKIRNEERKIEQLAQIHKMVFMNILGLHRYKLKSAGVYDCESLKSSKFTCSEIFGVL